MNLDLNDPEIRKMAEANHYPVEWWGENGALQMVYCHMCHNPWPCPTVRELRAWASLASDGPGARTDP